MPEKKSGWEPENKTHFDDIVELYDRVRPDYPAPMLADIFDYCNGEGRNALEIGLGTGKATEPFLQAGWHIDAVEAGAEMANYARKKLRHYTHLNIAVGSFEDADLPENHYDLIYAASAFHWVNPELGCPKAFRLLKPGGTLALLRYNFVSEDGDPAYEAIQEVYQQYFYSYHTTGKRLPRKAYEQYFQPSEIKWGYGFSDMSAYGFQDVVMHLYDAAQTFDAQEYCLFLDTLADHRALPPKNRALLYQGVKKIIESHGGTYRLSHVFQLYMGKKL